MFRVHDNTYTRRHTVISHCGLNVDSCNHSVCWTFFSHLRPTSLSFFAQVLWHFQQRYLFLTLLWLSCLIYFYISPMFWVILITWLTWEVHRVLVKHWLSKVGAGRASQRRVAEGRSFSMIMGQLPFLQACSPSRRKGKVCSVLSSGHAVSCLPYPSHCERQESLNLQVK